MEIAIFGVLLCHFLLLLISLFVVKKRISSLLRSARSFYESPGEGKQSPLADILDNVANRLANALIVHVKAWLLAQNSIAVRQEKAQLRQNIQNSAPPLMGALMKYSPGIGKVMANNPELAQMAINAFAGMGGKKESESENNNGHHELNSPFKI